MSLNVEAEQLTFEKTIQKNAFQFNYKWIDANRQEQHFSFLLDAKKVSSDFRHFKALRPPLLKMYSTKKLKQAASKLDPRKGQVEILPVTNGVEYKVHSHSKQWQAETVDYLQSVYHSSLKEYLHKEYYTEFEGISINNTKETNTLYFKPDHRRFVDEGTDTTTPIVDELRQRFPNYPARKVAEFVNGWIQTIPYDDLERRETSNGAGFEPPVHLINKNRGDCDSKVTLMAHILKQLYPRLRMVIIYLPEHALIGLNVSVVKNDEVIEIDGLKFVLAEPVGPATIKLADASDRSKRLIDSGAFKVEKLY